MAKAKPKPPRKDALDQFAEGTHERALQLVLWKHRHLSEEMTVIVTPEDIEAFDQCMKYQSAHPQILLYRPEGLPATAAIPAAGNRRAVPARPAEPPRPYVIVSLVERGTKNTIKPIENNEEDYKKGELGRQLQVMRRNIPDYAASLRRTAATGDFSSGTLEDIARALELWGRS